MRRMVFYVFKCNIIYRLCQTMKSLSWRCADRGHMTINYGDTVNSIINKHNKYYEVMFLYIVIVIVE